jgi:hypothetical protein
MPPSSPTLLNYIKRRVGIVIDYVPQFPRVLILFYAMQCRMGDYVTDYFRKYLSECESSGPLGRFMYQKRVKHTTISNGNIAM